jgi:hypothetical protein
MYCSSCGENIPEGARFCKHCGVEVQPESENVKTQGKLLERTSTLSLPEHVLDTRVAWLVIAGGAMVAVGSLMPWVSTTTVFGSINRSAWQFGSGLSDDGTGPLLLIVGLLLASVGWAMLGGRARRYGSKRTAIVIEAILLLLLILIFKPLIDFVNQGGTKFTVGSIGIGYWISVVGTLVALVGSIKFPKSGTKAQTEIETARSKTKKRIVYSVSAVLILLAGLAVGLALSRTKQQKVILNARELSIDGVHLEKGDAQQSSSKSEVQLVTQLNAVIGSSHVFNSTICDGSQPVTVAQWHDLAIFFVNGGFGGFVYDYKGWYSSGIYFAEQVSPVPPAGTKLTPLLGINGGITVGDVVTPPKSLSYETKNGYETLSGAGYTDGVSLTLAPTTRTQNFIVTGISFVIGNCGQ